MSLLDTASLIVTPNGYKEGTLYSVIPSDGSGDMSVVRATTATRVNSAGLVELVPYNLINWSEAFDNADWTKANTTVTANTILSPIGTLTADSVAETTATNSHELASSAVTFSASTKYTTTLYAKWNVATTRNIHIRFGNCASANVGASFDKNGNFVNYTGGSNGTLDSYSATNVGDGWWKFVVTITTANVTSSGLGIYVYYMDGTTIVYTGNTSQVINFWGAQTVEGSTALDYQKTETRLNIPRLDYSNGTCPSLLVEPQRTNLFVYSEQFDNVNWVGITITITPNATTSPSGITNADKIIASAVSGDKLIYQLTTTSIGTAYTTSVYYKSAEYTQAYIRLGGVSNNPYVLYNLTTESLVSSSNVTASSIESVGNGWYKVSATVVATGLVIAPNIMMLPATGYTLGGDNIPEFTGNGSDGGYIWGAQIEAGAYPTSYIPTTSASVTRNADVVSKTGISSLIGQTEGTMFVDFKLNGSSYSDNTSLYYVTLAKNSPFNFFELIRYNNSLLYFIADNGVGIGPRVLTAFGDLNGRYKFAVSYNSSGLKCFLNGVLIYTSADIIPTCDEVNFGHYDAFVNQQNNFNSVALWKTELTNTQCIQLTTI